jgi:excisionase family DNA binding protein
MQKGDQMGKSFYSTAEVAVLFGMNRVTIYRWVKEGKIGAYKIGKRHKIPVSEVVRLLKKFGFSESAIRDLCGDAQDSQVEKAVAGPATDEVG